MYNLLVSLPEFIKAVCDHTRWWALLDNWILLKRYGNRCIMDLSSSVGKVGACLTPPFFVVIIFDRIFSVLSSCTPSIGKTIQLQASLLMRC